MIEKFNPRSQYFNPLPDGAKAGEQHRKCRARCHRNETEPHYADEVEKPHAEEICRGDVQHHMQICEEHLQALNRFSSITEKKEKS